MRDFDPIQRTLASRCPDSPPAHPNWHTNTD